MINLAVKVSSHLYRLRKVHHMVLPVHCVSYLALNTNFSRNDMFGSRYEASFKHDFTIHYFYSVQH